LPRSSSDAIDQSSAFERNLGGGISSCDGTRAIFVFNRGTETSTVLTGIDAVAKAHGNFKRAETWPHESGVRYVLHSSGDKNRELVLTVLVFHVRYSGTVMPDARVDGEWQVTLEPAVRWSNLTGGNQPKADIRPETPNGNSRLIKVSCRIRSERPLRLFSDVQWAPARTAATHQRSGTRLTK